MCIMKWSAKTAWPELPPFYILCDRSRQASRRRNQRGSNLSRYGFLLQLSKRTITSHTFLKPPMLQLMARIPRFCLVTAAGAVVCKKHAIVFSSRAVGLSHLLAARDCPGRIEATKCVLSWPLVSLCSQLQTAADKVTYKLVDIAGRKSN